jgi:hypothetical protein
MKIEALEKPDKIYLNGGYPGFSYLKINTAFLLLEVMRISYRLSPAFTNH